MNETKPYCPPALSSNTTKKELRARIMDGRIPKSEAEHWAKDRIAYLEAIITGLLCDLPSCTCENFHHKKDDYHSAFSACPPMKRFDFATREAHDAFSNLTQTQSAFVALEDARKSQ